MLSHLSKTSKMNSTPKVMRRSEFRLYLDEKVSQGYEVLLRSRTHYYYVRGLTKPFACYAFANALNAFKQGLACDRTPVIYRVEANGDLQVVLDAGRFTDEFLRTFRGIAHA